MRVRYSWTTIILICFLLFGCGGAEWHKIEFESAYQVPKSVTIQVGSPPDLKLPAQRLASALAEELQSRGIAARVLPAAGGAGEINIDVYHWDTLPKGFSGTRPSSAKGTLTVFVDTATIGLHGTVSGWKTAGGNINDAASSVGRLIGRTIATGPKQPPTEP